MPRAGALLPLSREHHTSLVVARAARKAADDKGSAVYSALVRIEEHWHAVLAAHFAQEEQLIHLAADTLDPESVARIFTEHAELRTLACGPCALEPALRLRRFADLLAAHVRYEERVLFPQLQAHPCIAAKAT
ncbi:hypothetical protein [Nitrosomonas sp. Nm166]|uniref:hypothetical protein n=1 Tax=Nitrosomonas sp. Nm166 TaxID=1881054 RepID=UPI0008E1B98E|nr:hypothetical protein [Nitrosomonas sp. Nm166]SFF16222.1 hypothetical protein SAMN05428977_10603 [Nitrosomonas sp. Nm166]